MTIYEEIVTLVDHLTLGEKARLLEHLSSAVRHDLEVEAFLRMPWQMFIEQTAGILADSPIERPDQLGFEEREPLE